MSLLSGEVAVNSKRALVSPRLKKPSLDPDDAKSYRPISNVCFLSKLVERAVTTRFTKHVEDNKLFPDNQSAYRRFHSTEIAVLLVFNYLVRAIDNGKVSALVLLDMSAAFDTVDHDVLLTVLNTRFCTR